MDTINKDRKETETEIFKYPEDWKEHRFLCFMKVGWCLKHQEFDAILLPEAIDRYGKGGKAEIAKLLRKHADLLEDE